MDLLLFNNNDNLCFWRISTNIHLFSVLIFMKRFLLRFLLFVLPIFLIILFAEIKLSAIPTTYEFKKKSFEAQLENVEILILGNSQAFGGINPEYLTRPAFNLCNNSQTFYYDAEITQKYLSELPKLKYVLINISFFSFWHIMEDSHEPWRENFYYKYWDIRPEEAGPVFINKFSHLSIYSPKTVLKLFFSPENDVNFFEVYNSNGWALNDTTRNYKINKEEAQGRIALFTKQYIHKNRIIQNNHTIEKLLSSLNKIGVTPIFFSTPLPSVFSSMIPSDILSENDQILDDLCDRYGCTYYDYSNDERFIKADFIDVNHLNFVGAEKFSRIINNEILSHQTGEKE